MKKMNKKLKKEHDLLKEVLVDLNRELRSLRASKEGLEKQVEKCSGDISSTQGKEVALRDQISELMKKEALLVRKQAAAKDRVAELSKKIEKVKAVERELKAV